MAVIGVAWNGGLNDDIHVLRNQTSRPLDNLLVIEVDQGAAFFLKDLDAAKRALHNITATGFSITFPNTAAHGAALNTNNGAVTAAAAVPAGAYPRNFLVTATVTATVNGAAKDFSISIRVHVHTSVSQVFLSPPSLTARLEATPATNSFVAFSAFAKFDDGVFGDITRHGNPDNPSTQLTWINQATPLLELPDPKTGSFRAKAGAAKGDTGLMQVQLPAELGGLNATTPGQVTFDDGWGLRRTISAVSGSASTTPTDDALNLLLLPDGFLADEQTAFRTYARNLITKWRSTKSVAPYNRMPLNVFTVDISSVEKGTTVRNLMFYKTRAAGNVQGSPLPTPVKPKAGQTPVLQKIEELIYVVGLPEPAEKTATLGTAAGPGKLADWNTLYTAAKVGTISQKLFDQWRNLADYTLAFERDTAFGIAGGRAPQVAAPDDGRVPNWHERRAQRTDLDKLLGALVDGAGNSLATRWTTLPGRLSVAILLSGGRDMGGTLPAPEEIILTSLNNNEETLLSNIVAGTIPTLRSYKITKKLPIASIATLTHETGHALSLGDEYGGSHEISGDALTDVRRNEPNLQALQDVTDNGTTTGKITGSAILWQQWPRISAAGLVVDTVTGAGSNFDVTLRPGHAALFKKDQIVRLRLRPFYKAVSTDINNPENKHLVYVGESVDFKVGPNPPATVTLPDGTQGEKLGIVQVGPGAFNPGAFTKNKAILFRPQGTLMMHDKITAYITSTGHPLNRTTNTCSDQDDDEQPIPQIAGLKKGHPKRSLIVGLCDGGHEFFCGVFHARGICMMRAEQVATVHNDGRLYDFCPVCRYILVDTVDPSLHGPMDDLYGKIYPVFT